MLQRGYERSAIGQEFKKEQKFDFFDMKGKNFLHNIDTFYYSIKLVEDFRRDSEDSSVIGYRRWIKSIDRESVASGVYVGLIPGLSDCSFAFKKFSKYYDLCITKEEWFDVFVASHVPCAADGGESVTSEVIVQLRSSFLWQYSTRECFDKSLEKVKVFLDYFGFHIDDIKENRVDYCWHSNYFKDPDKYFARTRLENYAVSRITRVNESSEKDIDHYETDYVTFGKRSNKIFLRIYNKTKEVIEMGYKAWFLKLWQLSGMISRYDFFVLDLCYDKKSWKYLDTARLLFYLEYGKNEEYLSMVNALLNAKKPDRKAIKNLADLLTPKVTLVFNIEFQVMRRATKQFELLPTSASDYVEQSEKKRVYTFLDNTQFICEYLTYDWFRLCEKDNDNISRRSLTDFWHRLRGAEMYCSNKYPDNIKITRKYQHEKNVDLMKSRFINASIGLSLLVKGVNGDDLIEDVSDNLCFLNDNDFEYGKNKKINRITRFDLSLFNNSHKDVVDSIDRLTADDWYNYMVYGGGLCENEFENECVT